MASSKKKADHGNHIDRISDLPSDILNGILKYLNIVELVRTSILSRKWRYKWISVPQLCFDDSFFRKCAHLEDHEVSKIITEVLLVHNRPVHTFTLRIHIPSDSTIKIECLDKLFQFLSRSGIKDLGLEKNGWPFQTTSHVFSCQDLTYFSLSGFIMSVPLNFDGFKRLLDLHLQFIRFEPGALERLVSGCPLLQNLTLCFCSGFECFDFSAPTLKVLKIFSSEVTKPVCLKRANNLIDLTLWGGVSNSIIGLPEIKKLVMGPGYRKVMSVGLISQIFGRSFSSLEYLTLTLDLNGREKIQYIVRLLKSAPNLVELVIKPSHDSTQGPYDSEELECCSWRFSQLQTVKITVGGRFQLTMSLIRLILANSPLLETLTFHVWYDHSQLDASMLLSISEDLLVMERASQRAKILFLHKEK